MKFPLFIARRYVVAKKSHNAINIIAIIAIIAVLLISASFICLLSVFNGFDSLVTEMYNSFYSDVKIVPEKGKVFSLDSTSFDKIKEIEGIKDVSISLEDNALAIYNDKQWYVTVKGVDENYSAVTAIDSMLYEGEYLLEKYGPRAIVGRGVSINLGILLDGMDYIKLIVPKKTKRISYDPNKALIQKNIRVSGKFSIQNEIDNAYVIVPLDYAQSLFEYNNQVSAIEILLNENTNQKKVISQLNKLFDKGFLVKNKHQQNELLYKTMQTEKWAIFLILTFILLIASFNLIENITMLIIEKKDDIIMLKNLGASIKQIQSIYFVEGLLITAIGLISGLILGLVICYLQQQFGLIKLHGMFVIDAYPVKIVPFDIVIVIGIVLFIGLVSSYYPVQKLIGKYFR